MPKTYLVLLMFLMFITQSCVPTKDLTYIQQKEASANQVIVPVHQKPYRIQSNDLLVIKVTSRDERINRLFQESFDGNAANRMIRSDENAYFEGYRVDIHGNIKLPLVGVVNVLGYTTEEIEEKIENEIYSKFLERGSSLFVKVNIAGMNFTVNGEVNRPGSITLFRDRVTILDAIANAGDITMLGDRKNVVLVRHKPTGIEMHHLDLTDARIMASPHFYIEPNDYILVNPLKQKSWGTGATGLQSITTIITVLSLITSVIILTR